MGKTKQPLVPFKIDQLTQKQHRIQEAQVSMQIWDTSHVTFASLNLKGNIQVGQTHFWKQDFIPLQIYS